MATMWAAVFADVGVSVLAIINAIRALSYRKYKKQSMRQEEKEDVYKRQTLYVAEKEKYLGSIVISDTVREDVPDALAGLRKAGVKRVVMLTGDRQEVGDAVGERLSLDEVYGGLLRCV